MRSEAGLLGEGRREQNPGRRNNNMCKREGVCAKLPAGLTVRLGRVGSVSYQGILRPSMDSGLNAVVVLGVVGEELKNLECV